jgi:hypothetical protein
MDFRFRALFWASLRLQARSLFSHHPRTSPTNLPIDNRTDILGAEPVWHPPSYHRRISNAWCTSNLDASAIAVCVATASFPCTVISRWQAQPSVFLSQTSFVHSARAFRSVPRARTSAPTSACSAACRFLPLATNWRGTRVSADRNALTCADCSRPAEARVAIAGRHLPASHFRSRT